MESYKQRFIEFMVEIGVLRFGDFTTKSGRKTPFFVNTGLYRNGSQINRLAEFYSDAIKQAMDEPFEILFGPAYKGIPLAVATAAELARRGQDVGFCFNRKEAKDHGEGGNLVGEIPQSGDRVVIIEDVTTAGTSIRETMPLLQSCGDVKVSALVVSVDRMERGTGTKNALAEIQENYGMKTFAIVNLDEIVSYLHNREVLGKIHIDDQIAAKIADYRAQFGGQLS